MALSERFETYGSNPVAKAPLKRRHFAVDNGSNWNTSAVGTDMFQRPQCSPRSAAA